MVYQLYLTFVTDQLCHIILLHIRVTYQRHYLQSHPRHLSITRIIFSHTLVSATVPLSITLKKNTHTHKKTLIICIITHFSLINGVRFLMFIAHVSCQLH